MDATVASKAGACSKPAGRPTGTSDYLASAGEAVTEAIAIVQDDLDAIILANDRLRVARAIVTKIESHLTERIERICRGKDELTRLSSRVESAVATRALARRRQ